MEPHKHSKFTCINISSKKGFWYYDYLWFFDQTLSPHPLVHILHTAIKDASLQANVDR